MLRTIGHGLELYTIYHAFNEVKQGKDTETNADNNRQGCQTEVNEMFRSKRGINPFVRHAPGKKAGLCKTIQYQLRQSLGTHSVLT